MVRWTILKAPRNSTCSKTIRSLRAHKLSLECLELLRAKMAGPNLVVSDAMIATVVNLAVSEVSALDFSFSGVLFPSSHDRI
jgi:hypothetical protein